VGFVMNLAVLWITSFVALAVGLTWWIASAMAPSIVPPDALPIGWVALGVFAVAVACTVVGAWCARRPGVAAHTASIAFALAAVSVVASPTWFFYR
jgi:hypothetical protein